jgi:hypothetical protein
MSAPASSPVHSDLSPSGASCWTVCTAQPSYVRANKDKIPANDDTEYSKEGTAAHDWASKILLGLADLSEVPDDMRPHVAAYVALAERLKDKGDAVLVETKVPLFYRPEDRGTVDYALVSEKRLYILDLKYGAGVMVDAKNNKQLAIYARSLIVELESSGLHEFPADMLVTIAIFQPRAHTGDTTKLWALTVGDLVKFTDEIGTIAAHVQGNEAEPERYPVKFAPSDETCQFCKAKRICTKRKEWLAEPIPFDVCDTFTKEGLTETLADNAPECLETEQIVALVKNRKAIQKWLDDVAEGAQARLEAGQEIPGLKLVQGKEGNRAWSDEEAADTLVSKFIPAGERYAPKQLLSVAQMEKLLKPHEAEFSTRFKNRLAELITRPAGKPTLVLEDDPRPSIAIKAETVFANEEAPATAPAAVEEDPLA